jgi:hypothetical protein
VDTAGDGKFDILEVETRSIKNPRTYGPTGIPFHADGRTIVRSASNHPVHGESNQIKVNKR